jgi:hypothetical protein
MRKLWLVTFLLALAVPGPVVAEVGSRRAVQISPGVPLAEDFDGVTAPALPQGWVATNVQGPAPLWVTDTTNSDTAPNAAHVDDPSVVADKRLDSPAIFVSTDSAQLTFRHRYYFYYFEFGGGAPEAPNCFPEPCFEWYDGGVLEISINGGSFTDILSAGGSFVQNGYGTAITSIENPINGRDAWVGPSGYRTTVVNLPPAAAGTAVVLRWRMGSGGGAPSAFTGWWIDSIQVCDGYPCDAVPKPALLHLGTTGNGVWEPGEMVDVIPFFLNNGDATLTLTGAASSLAGPSGATYTIVDPTASYEIFPGFLGSCDDTGNCYSFAVDNPATRPAAHWDASFHEALDNGLGVTRVLHIGESFPDVPPSNPFYFFIENILHNGVTGGCGGGSYCPGASMARKQMAVFVLKSKLGRTYQPPACAGVFTDVACPGPFTDWIEDLYARGIVAGCGPGPAYCPDNPVLRQQMAVFLLKTLLGSTYVPPACEGIFPDVPCSSPFAPWIEDLANRQISGGCGGGNYCPANATTRGQMAPFLAKTFGLMLYGP